MPTPSDLVFSGVRSDVVLVLDENEDFVRKPLGVSPTEVNFTNVPVHMNKPRDAAT